MTRRVERRFRDQNKCFIWVLGEYGMTHTIRENDPNRMDVSQVYWIFIHLHSIPGVEQFPNSAELFCIRRLKM